MRWVRHAARVTETKNAESRLMGKCAGKGLLENCDRDRMIILKMILAKQAVVTRNRKRLRIRWNGRFFWRCTFAYYNERVSVVKI
jgi:hypothetical protein